MNTMWKLSTLREEVKILKKLSKMSYSELINELDLLWEVTDKNRDYFTQVFGYLKRIIDWLESTGTVDWLEGERILTMYKNKYKNSLWTFADEIKEILSSDFNHIMDQIIVLDSWDPIYSSKVIDQLSEDRNNLHNIDDFEKKLLSITEKMPLNDIYRTFKSTRSEAEKFRDYERIHKIISLDVSEYKIAKANKIIKWSTSSRILNSLQMLSDSVQEE